MENTDKVNGQTLIFIRNAFFRRLHFLVLFTFLLSLLDICVLSFVLFHMLKNLNPPLYFATDHIGRLIDIIPVTQPNMSTDEVSNWATEAAQSAYSYDYVNYRAQLQGAQKYFTTYGWTNYMNALKASNNLVGLTNRRMIFIANVVEKPKLITEGILGGAYAWKFTMSMLVTYMLPPYDDQSKFSNPLTVTVIIQRQSILQGYKGLGIVQMIGAMASAQEAPQELSVPTS